MGKGRQKGTETSVTHVEGLLDYTKSRYYPEGSKIIDRKAACVRFGYKNVGQAEGRGQRQRDLGSCAHSQERNARSGWQKQCAGRTRAKIF